MSSEGCTPISLPLETSLRQYDHTKRVVVSCVGFIALICGNKLAIIDLRYAFLVRKNRVHLIGTRHLTCFRKNYPEITFRQTHKEHPQRFADVAFNDSGELLYAWATGSAMERAGALFVYRVTELDIVQPESKGFYKFVWFLKPFAMVVCKLTRLLSGHKRSTADQTLSLQRLPWLHHLCQPTALLPSSYPNLQPRRPLQSSPSHQ
jgi:hypothetical protein